MDSKTCQNCRHRHAETGTCRINPPTLIQSPTEPRHGFSAFPEVRPEWGCGRWRSMVVGMGTKHKLSDEEIRAIVAERNEPIEGIPPMAFKRSELIRELMDRGMSQTPATKRLETLVRRGVLQMGENPYPRAYPTPGVYYWVDHGEGAGTTVLKALQAATGSDGTMPIGVRELYRKYGETLGISLATLQRRLEDLLAEGKAFRTEGGQWSASKQPALVEVD